jgi:hypothetical protein
LQYFQNKGIFVSCTHDCWIISSNHSEELKRVYFKTLLDTLLYNDECVISKFFKDHNVPVENLAVSKFLNQIKENKIILKTQLENGFIEMSPFILTND